MATGILPDWNAKHAPSCGCGPLRLITGVMADGRRNYYAQCAKCGRHGSPIAKLALTERERCEAEERLVNLAQVRAEVDRIYAEREAEREGQRTLEAYTWWICYDDYLRSDLWREKRLVVLERDHYVCQGCLKRRAVEVHHTTYRHVFAEPLYELVSLCVSCHEAITRVDRQGIPREYREATE